jgi:gamma-glutamyltranspeptidase/glutathione hydrolase
MSLLNRFKKCCALLLLIAFLLSSTMACGKPAAPPLVELPASEAPISSPEPEGDNLPPSYIRFSDEEMDLSVRNATGANGVVTSASPLSSKVGLTILERGGNAVDAAVAVAIALGMVEPNASGLGGDGYMLVYEAASGKTTFLDYKGAAPAAFTLDYYKTLGTADRHKGPAVLVPGAVAGLYKANELFGTMSFAELIQPTIDYATYGIPVTQHMADVYMDSYTLLNGFPETARIYLHDGFPYLQGETYANPDFAQTLKLIAEQGPDAFYKGEIAEDLVRSVKDAGGVLTMEDMANYQVSIRPVISTTYRGYKVVTTSPESGGIGVLEALNIAELYDVAAMGHNSADSLHMWAEIFKIMQSDRRAYVGDPDFTDVRPALGLAKKAYASKRAKDIDMTTAALGALPGTPASANYDSEGQHTTHVSIIDKDGNMVAMTNTLSTYFGSTVTVYDRGFILNNLSFNFSLASPNGRNAPEPNKKVRSSISPLLIFSPEGKPFATIGTPGAGRIPTTMSQIVSNLVDFHMDVQDAINQPRIFQDSDGALSVEGGISEDVLKELQRRGHILELHTAHDMFFGGVQGVLRLPDNTMEGGADPRRDGKALAY